MRLKTFTASDMLEAMELVRAELGKEDVAALERGLENLGRHIRNTGQYGVPITVAINHFSADTAAEISAIHAYVEQRGVKAYVCKHWSDGTFAQLEQPIPEMTTKSSRGRPRRLKAFCTELRTA